MIFGIGIDIIEVPRIAAQLSEDGRFKTRLFTEGEIAYCEGKASADPFYAARFAAKEALLKALGTGLRAGMRWTEIEVVHDEAGRPSIRVSGRVRQWVEDHAISHLHVSLSHVRGVASAVVIAETED